MTITLEDVRAAAGRIAGSVERTPCLRSKTLSKLTGSDLYLKYENLQFTSSFKDRGALNKLLSLTPEERGRGVIAMSAGNHAQGVAYHAARLGIPTTIVMPEGTPFVKIKYTRDHGARVLVEGATLADAAERAHALAEAEGYVFVHPYDDDLIVAGQGTAALEMLEQVPSLDTFVIAVGGGGLISGCATAAKGLKPETKIYGVEVKAYPPMYNAVHGAAEPVGGATIAEGIAVKNIAPRCVEIVKRLVEDMLLVSEQEIEHAIALLLGIEKTVVEGAGAAGLAAVLARPDLFKGRKVGLILCGGNIDMRLLANVIMRDLSRQGRILHLAIDIEDRPGLLARIAAVVGHAGANILEVSHNRMVTDVSVKSATLGITVEALDAQHGREVVAKLVEAGYPARVLTPGGGTL